MILDFLYSIIFILIGWSLPGLMLDKKNIQGKKYLRILLFFHFFMATIYFLITRDGGGDAWGYWLIAKGMSPEEFLLYLYQAKGTYFMYSLNYLPANILGMPFFANTIFFSLLGFVGIIFFYLIALELIPYNSRYKGYKLFPLLFFMPSLNFWASGVGKDTILFFCIGMFTYAMLNIARRIPLLVLSILLSFLLRPHVTLFLFLSFGLAYLLDSKLSTFKRVSLLILLLGATVVLLPSVLEFSKIQEASVESFNQFSTKKSLALSNASVGSAVDISSYPLPLKVFTFLYRPFFFDVRGIPALVNSFENLALLFLSVQAFRHKPIDTFKSAPVLIKALLIFLIVGTLIFSQTLGNVGIMIRMRNMFLPGMLIYILWSFSLKIEIKKKKLFKRNLLKNKLNDEAEKKAVKVALS
jgi:hypothetical protein